LKDRLKQILSDAESIDIYDISTIKNTLDSTNADDRLKALLLARRFLKQNEMEYALYDLAVKMIEDEDNDCRWQSIIIIGEFIATPKMENIWEIIMTYGNSNDQDMRSAIATVLLEHYFEQNPDQFENKFKMLKQEIKKGKTNLRDTLSLCSINNFGSNENNGVVAAFVGKK